MQTERMRESLCYRMSERFLCANVLNLKVRTAQPYSTLIKDLFICPLISIRDSICVTDLPNSFTHTNALQIIPAFLIVIG